MTIRKHRAWGEPGRLDPTGVVVGSDEAAAAEISRARRGGRPNPMIELTGGDLWRTLGGRNLGRGAERAGSTRFPIDLGVATIDGDDHPFVAHVLVRRRAWQGRIFVAMNAQYLGPWDLGPKAHPNDGLLDISDADLSWSDKLAARRRAVTGTHLPHSSIAVRRTASFATDFDPPGLAYLDGERVARVRHLELRVEPDAFTVVV
ncbi:MAG: hypothetical protein JST73_03530 [Actinobacteria bacterium]|nr:hypothetical protein [Actinomycetota bacterium]